MRPLGRGLVRELAVAAAKILDDECYNNELWARIGGVTLSHLKHLELELLGLLEFDVLRTHTLAPEIVRCELCT